MRKRTKRNRNASISGNKHDIRDFLDHHLASFRSTLKNTSYDASNDVYLCENTDFQPIYDFDRYVEAHHKSVKQPASPDAICVGEKVLYFVEFKNQQLNDINRTRIRKKFAHGTELLQELLSSFSPRDCARYFYVVHSSPRVVRNRRRFGGWSHVEESALALHLKELNANFNHFYDNIRVADVDEFIRSHPELACPP